MSGQIRIAIDPLFALEEGEDNLLRGHDRSSALLMAAEGNGFADVHLLLRSSYGTSEMEKSWSCTCRKKHKGG